MAGALGRLNIDLTLNTANFTNAINRSQRQTEQFGQSIRVSLQAITVQQERMVSQTAKSSALFARFASVTASALSIHQVINYADSWTELQNRLKLVTESSVELNKATQAVYDIAQKTYQSLDATAQVYQRFADNADRLGLSQQKVAELTETVSKAVAISGASATAAQAALTQFGQALASGQLRGEELNSVMEQTPALAKAIADGMGVSVGELRKKAQDGEMTIEKVIQALERAADSVDKKFATSVTTVSQGFTNLQSAMTKFIGEANQGTGATQLFTTGMITLANNLSLVAKVVEGIAVTALVAKLSQWTKATYLKNQTTLNEAKATLQSAEANSVAATSAVRKAWADKEAATSALNRAKMEYQVARGTNAEKIALDNLIATKSLARTASLNYTQALTAENVAQRALTTARRQSTVAGRALNSVMGLAGGPIGLVLTGVVALGMGLYEYSENVKQAKLESIEFAHSLDTSTEALNKMSNATLVANLSKVSSGINAQLEKIEEIKQQVISLQGLSKYSVESEKAFTEQGVGDLYLKRVAEKQKELDAAMGIYAEQVNNLERQRANMQNMLATLKEKVGDQAPEYKRYATELQNVDAVINSLKASLKSLGIEYESLIDITLQATNSQVNAATAIAKQIDESIEKSQRSVAKAQATGKALAKLNAEDVLASRKITPDMQGYDKALQAEIEAQLALQAKRTYKPSHKSTIDYAKQYTKILTELEEKQASLIADGQSIQLYGTTSSFNEYTSALADIKQNKDKFDAILKIDPKAIETIKEKAKAIDDLARANSVAQFAYDRGKEIEQMQFETTLIGKTRAEQEKLNALRQIDVLYQQASVDLGEKELVNLQRNVELTKQQIEEELRKREAMKGDPMAGLKQGLSDFSESAMDVMENVRNVTTNALNNMSDALADFALTGKGSFKDFANAVISDITRMVMKMLIFKAIEAGGQAMGFDMGWMSKGHAYGGYTGHGGKFEPKGIVHGGEFVFTKEATAKLGVGNLYRLMHAAQGYASGGFVGAVAGRMLVTTPQPTLARAGGVQMTVVNHITVTGNGDAVLAQAMKEAAQQGTEAGAQKAHAMMLQDFQSNGAARRTLGV
ncbi:phage tail tape measure protein [Proteus faecis]|uniref:Phage tail tape measure protein n=5 Tax=Enterobacterales TaxID=91347 RepID=A0AAW7CP11_9GAMM|nr:MULTISPECIES: phage tail tape measure protein [Enterobacterales]MDL5167979.1 phage tail tape measure protein [Proteus faecis]MDL5191210.1 phage tail tape measure protein [Escherichia coli]MDL5275964.1 phage tail tape measure protein [Proteus faecis]MDL5279531.1 phage tail tape measure protein [Proteus faecis]MDL5308657.1 phage tail tape measure protein [Proteus faecis]